MGKLLNNTMQAPLSIFACKGVLGGLKYLLGKGNVDANQKDSDQKTPLHWAVSNGHIAIARQLLLVEHVRVTEKDKDGNTALQLAAGASNPMQRRFLIGILLISINIPLSQQILQSP
jgi:ankyrin repeat protein